MVTNRLPATRTLKVRVLRQERGKASVAAFTGRGCLDGPVDYRRGVPQWLSPRLPAAPSSKVNVDSPSTLRADAFTGDEIAIGYCECSPWLPVPRVPMVAPSFTGCANRVG
jgi:hypothetical protein